MEIHQEADIISLDHDILAQLLMTRGAAPDNIARHAKPTLRNFLPDPSAFQDMDLAAERLSDAIAADEKITN